MLMLVSLLVSSKFIIFAVYTHWLITRYSITLAAYHKYVNIITVINKIEYIDFSIIVQIVHSILQYSTAIINNFCILRVSCENLCNIIIVCVIGDIKI